MGISVNRVKTIANIVNDFAVVRRCSTQIMNNWWKDMSPSQRELVGILTRHPHGTSIKELARIIGVSSSAITQRVEALEKLGLVERTVSSHDNRFARILLTRQATEMLNKTIPSFSRHVDKNCFYVLNDDELKLFSELLGKITHTVEPLQNR